MDEEWYLDKISYWNMKAEEYRYLNQHDKVEFAEKEAATYELLLNMFRNYE